MQIGNIEKHLEDNCSLEDIQELSKALGIAIKHLPNILVSELYLRALTVSVNMIGHKKGDEPAADLIKRLCKEHNETEEYIRGTAIDAAMQTISSLKHGDIFDMLGLEDDDELFKFIDIAIILNL